MKRGAVAIVVACALALSACGGEAGSPPIETVTPTPWPGDPIERGAPSPSPTPIPSQAQLSARAEVVYRAFFDEWMRLERAGGADQPTQILLDNGADNYLEIVMGLLRHQKETGYTVSGPASTTEVVASPGGDYDGIDPRYTLKVCEDHTKAIYVLGQERRQGRLVQGTVYLREVDGQLKLVGIDTMETERCTI